MCPVYKQLLEVPTDAGLTNRILRKSNMFADASRAHHEEGGRRYNAQIPAAPCVEGARILPACEHLPQTFTRSFDRPSSECMNSSSIDSGSRISNPRAFSLQPRRVLGTHGSNQGRLPWLLSHPQLATTRALGIGQCTYTLHSDVRSEEPEKLPSLGDRG